MKKLSRVVLPSALAAFLGLGMIGCTSNTEPQTPPPPATPQCHPVRPKAPSPR